MGHRDEAGWTVCDRGCRHWGRHGAAGLLVSAPDPVGGLQVLLVRRARWTHHGGTWAPPGGARSGGEPAARAAIRETSEECGPLPAELRPHGVLADDHGGWSYQTYLAWAPAPFPVAAASLETARARWTPVEEVGRLALHPGFASSWPGLRSELEPVTLIVDGANVMGSRPDGWWRDRAGAIARLHGELVRWAADGVASLPDGAGGLDRWFPGIVLVVEGAARSAWPALAAEPSVRVVAAPGAGDDTIAELAATMPGRRVAVTADRELRRRCVSVGASVAGPRWLTALLD